MTISQHAQLLAAHAQTTLTATTVSRCSASHLTEGPASFAQESIWLDEQMRFQGEKDNLSIYHMIYAFRVSSINNESHVVLSRLRSSLQLVIEKHTSLRSSFYMSHDQQNKLIQYICPLTSIDEIVVESWIKNDDDLFKIIADEETNQFHLDISKGRVFRCHLIRYFDRSSDDVLIFKLHHLVFDGTSETLFFNDLHEAYMTGQLAIVPNDTITYLDYARWERTLDMLDALSFWKENLKDYQMFELPYDHRLLTKARTGSGSTVVVKDFDEGILLTYASRQEVTLFQLCLAFYYTFLFKLTSSQDFIVGGLVANRIQPGLDSMIGMFVNLVPYRFQIEPRETFQELVRRVQHLCYDVVSHAYVPFQSISKLIGSENGISTTIDIETIQDRYPFDTDLELVHIDLPVRKTQFDLSLSFKHILSRNTIHCSFDYSTDVFESSTIETLAKRFHQLIKQILCDDQCPIYEFSLLLENEHQILRNLNPSMPMAQNTDCIHWEFAHRAQEHPQKIGILMEDQSLSYGEILHYSQQLALYLLTHCHVRPGDIVCQLVERSIEMVLGILAIWMCGAIYTPFSPREPASRLHSRISSLQARVLLVPTATRHFMEQTSDLTIVEVDQIGEQTNDISALDNVTVISEHLSHIVFTSGSTGEPKMVQLRHRNFVSYIHSCLIKPTDIILQHASVAFDSHIEEIMGPLISSAQLAILKPDPYHLDIDYFSTAIAQHQVTFLFPVPTLLIMLTNFVRSLSKDEQCNRLKTLRFLSCGGEKLYLVTVLDILPFLDAKCSIHNYYGPAECTLATLHYEVTGHEPQNSIGLPIGRPMANARVYILDEFLQKVSPGQIGEIVIGGHGVFAGYRNRDDLTQQVLIEHDGYTCYRTGDLGRLDTNNGQIEYLGRRDHQVKIRGQRIELDEIEHTIMRCSPNISNCIVLKITNASVDHLVAYIESSDENHSANDSDIRKFCIEHLSPFMVPSFFIVLDKFPLSQSGKIDRARLPPLNITDISKEQTIATSSMERQLSSIVAQAFDVSQTSLLNVNATFAQLGATSLGIVKVLALIRQQKLAGLHPVDIGILLDNPSVRKVAQALESLHFSDKEIAHAGTIAANVLMNGYEELRTSDSYELISEAPVKMFHSLLVICTVWLIHECLLCMALICSQSFLPLTCLIWLLGCISVSLITLKWLPSIIDTWWIRQLLVTAFGFAIPFTFEGDITTSTEHIYPRLVRWLGRNRIGQNVHSGTITNLLTIRRDLLDIGMNVMLGSDILFDDGNSAISIGDGSSLGNDCLIQAGAHIPSSTSVGSMTRVDSSSDFMQSNQVLVGIPARQTALFAAVQPVDNSSHQTIISYPIIQLIFIRFVSLILIFGIMHMTILPISIIIFSLIACILYSPKNKSFLLSSLTSTLVNDFNLCVGPFLGGTQWVNIVLNAFGATIHRTAIIADIDCIDDPHLIQIGPHVRISQRARVQAHTYEYRQSYMRPVIIGAHSHLMPNAFVLPGCHLDGNNTIYPCTLIMKGDKLPMHTNWQGSPARHFQSSCSFPQ
ncbi:unnamed protein product [Adineta steineri]|nr:unnamed protein product [Adineta steineri]